MYALLFLILAVVGGLLVVCGIGKERVSLIVSGLLVLLFAAVLSWFLGFWVEKLWFEALGYERRFWTEFIARAGLATGGLVVGGGLLLWLRAVAEPSQRVIFSVVSGLGALFGFAWGLAGWESFLLFLNRVEGGLVEPIIRLDVSFYLFVLPWIDRLVSLLTTVVALGLVGAVIGVIQVDGSWPATFNEWLDKLTSNRAGFRPLVWVAGMALLAFGIRTFTGAYHLLYSDLGVVSGPGWTDDTIRLPAHFITGVLLGISGLLLLVVPLIIRGGKRPRRTAAFVVGIPLALGAVSWMVGLFLLPVLLQWLYVKPNEVSVEKPYIENNIRFTRAGFHLGGVEEKQFPVSKAFTEETGREYSHILDQIRLWDPRALDAVYEQFQEIRLYYEFVDVDIDRYTIDGEYRQVMVSPRELALQNLPLRSQTFINERFKYTHGHGLTMVPVNEFTSGGLPRMLIKDLPPVSESEDLRVEQPGIYYGEMSSEFAVVNTEEGEFDYPKGESNVYAHYAGKGGVQLSSTWRKFVFGWKYGGTKFFLSGYPTRESRIQFHRDIRDRARTLAPFLQFDHDPYIVLNEGRLYWILDAYTTSAHYPYSESFTDDVTAGFGRSTLRDDGVAYLEGKNYIRNSVKVVIDAYEGSVDFYVFEPEDPLIRAWQRIFPGMFQPRDAMPDSLEAHVRYPEGFLLAQGLVFARYHMTDPEVFYNQEDLWVRATEKYYGQVQPVEPYYVMWEPPGSDSSEFILMFPFTPKRRQVLIGWIAGMCDGENYGRLLAYQFPKEKHVLGTQQVETKIDQDPYLSQQLSLWDQRGSRVVRGNVLAIPVGETLLYVEPIYLQAEAAAYPELRLVIIMHNDRLSYAPSFDEALAGIYSEKPVRATPGAPAATRSVDELIEQANSAFENYLKALGEKNFSGAADQLDSLSSTLRQLRDASGGESDGGGQGQGI